VTLGAFLSDLHRQGIRLSVDGDRLRCKAPAGALTGNIAAELQRRKNEIMAFLGAAEALVQQPAVVPLQPHGVKPPIYAVAGHNGDVFTYRDLAEVLGPDQPFFGLQPPGLDGRSAPVRRIDELATYFVDQILAQQPQGPQIIAGYCAGGAIAYELACQLERRGVDVGFVVMFGCPYPHAFRSSARMMRRVREHLRRLAGLGSYVECAQYLADFARRRTVPPAPAPMVTDPVLQRRAALEEITVAAVCRYQPGRFSGTVNMFLPNRAWAQPFQTRRWRDIAAHVNEYTGPDDCEMPTMLRAPHNAVFAEYFRDASTR
jgi:thioesterase domain-containing protein